MAHMSWFGVTVVGTAAVLMAAGGPVDAGKPLKIVPAASCGPGDNPETGLQGQVPAALRQGNFEGFNCNLTLVGQVQGDGASWVTDTFQDCAYHDTAATTDGRSVLGTQVIDISDPYNPTQTMELTTTPMVDPWESLKVNERRQMLGAVNGLNGGGGPEIDLYDVSGNCRYPQLLSSVEVGTGTDGGGVIAPIIGHEGNFAPDGLTYYGGDLRTRTGEATGQYYAIDIANASQPKLITTWAPGFANVHGLSVSKDGKRGYFVSLGGLGGPTPPPVAPEDATNGLLIADLSEVQERKPGAQIKLISTLFFNDGSVAQHTIPVKIKGKPYIIFVDEAGSGGLTDPVSVRRACDADLPPFPMARIIDISNERKPKIVSRLALETHDPDNCDEVIPDLTGLSIFTYGSHYCGVDDVDNATALACGYFNSGVRVFDIRNPRKPKEIAYYNPPAATSFVPGSHHALRHPAGQPDWCSAPAQFDRERGLLYTTCQDNGFMVLKFRKGVWPFKDKHKHKHDDDDDDDDDDGRGHHKSKHAKKHKGKHKHDS